MDSESPLAKLYYAIEDAYYSLMSALNKLIPVYKYFVIPVEKSGLPSLVVFLFLLVFFGAAGFVFVNYGGDFSGGVQQLLSGFNLQDVALPFPSPERASLRFSVEDERGGPIGGAQISLYLKEELAGEATTSEGGEAFFDKVPAKRISFKVSKEGFKEFEAEIDASQKRVVVVTLDCLVAGCLSPSPSPVLKKECVQCGGACRFSEWSQGSLECGLVDPSFSCKEVNGQCVKISSGTPTPTPLPLEKRSLRVSLTEAGQPFLKSAAITVKDGIDLSVLKSVSTSNGVADLLDLVVGSSVYVDASAEGYSRSDSGLLTLSAPLFDKGLELKLSRAPGAPKKTRITVSDEGGSPLAASIKIFEKGALAPFSSGESNANGSFEATLDSVMQWFLLVDKAGFVDYASHDFKGGVNQLVRLRRIVNETLPYCRVEAPGGGEVGVNDPVQVKIIYANLSAPPSNVTLFCGTDAGQQVLVANCLNSSGNCSAQCSYGQPGSKAVYAQIGDVNCRSTPVIAINVTTRGPFCSITLEPESISHNGSTTVRISYKNLTAAPVNNVLLVNCGSGGAANTVEARNCAGTSGNCTTICRYNFSPSQVLDNPTRPVFVSYGGAQCIRDVRFADSASSLEASVLFRARLLSNARVALYKLIQGQSQPVFYSARPAPGGKALFDQLVRGDSFVVRASDGSGVMTGSTPTVLDLPANSLNVSVELPLGFFNATALDSSTRATTPQLAGANVVFEAFCNNLTPDGSGYTRSFLSKGTCTAASGSCLLQANAFVSCFVNGSAPGFVDSSAATQYKVSEANGTLAVERAFSRCGGKNEPCCGSACSAGLACSRNACVDSASATEKFDLTGGNGVINSNIAVVVFRADPVFAADAVPFSLALGPGCAGLKAEISGDSGVVPCFNDLALPGVAHLKFDSSASGCLLKSSGLAMPNGEASLALSCTDGTQKTTLKLKVVGSHSEDAAQYSPASIAASDSASLFYLASQKQLEGQQLDVAPGVVAPAEAADSQPPIVSILEPSAGSIVTGPVEIIAGARDNRRVERVSFFIDGAATPLKVVATPPYSMVWDPSAASVSEGSHKIKAEARDASGNSASEEVTVSKRAETLVASGLRGLNNLVFDSGKLYYAYSGGIGLHSPACPAGCVFAEWRFEQQPTIPFAAAAGASQQYFLAYQNSSTGENRVGVRIAQLPPGGTLLPEFVVSNLSEALSSPIVFADSSRAFFHSSGTLYSSDGSSISAVASLASTPTGFGFDSNAFYASHNTPSGSRIVKKGYSDSGNSFSTLASTTGIVRSLLAADGWLYWLEDSPGRVCKILASGSGVPSCSQAKLLHPSSLAIDPSGNSLVFLDGPSLKRIATDWTGYATLATGLSSPKAIAVGAPGAFFSVSDASGAGAIKLVPFNP